VRNQVEPKLAKMIEAPLRRERSRRRSERRREPRSPRRESRFDVAARTVKTTRGSSNADGKNPGIKNFDTTSTSNGVDASNLPTKGRNSSTSATSSKLTSGVPQNRTNFFSYGATPGAPLGAFTPGAPLGALGAGQNSSSSSTGSKLTSSHYRRASGRKRTSGKVALIL